MIELSVIGAIDEAEIPVTTSSLCVCMYSCEILPAWIFVLGAALIESEISEYVDNARSMVVNNAFNRLPVPLPAL